MKHLSKSDLLKVLTAKRVNEETMKLASKVVGHTTVCSDCQKALDKAMDYKDRLRYEAINCKTEEETFDVMQIEMKLEKYIDDVLIR